MIGDNKKEDVIYKERLINILKSSNIIEKSLDRVIQSEDGDYVMQRIREEYLKDSTVTLFLIGLHSSENEGNDFLGRSKNYFIQRELQASLYNGAKNTRNGIVGIVLPEMYDDVFLGTNICSYCGSAHKVLNITDKTVIREFSLNYFIQPKEGCCWKEEDRYCILAKWDDFILDPDTYINQAFDKRFSNIAHKIKIYKLR